MLAFRLCGAQQILHNMFSGRHRRVRPAQNIFRYALPQCRRERVHGAVIKVRKAVMRYRPSMSSSRSCAAARLKNAARTNAANARSPHMEVLHRLSPLRTALSAWLDGLPVKRIGKRIKEHWSFFPQSKYLVSRVQTGLGHRPWLLRARETMRFPRLLPEPAPGPPRGCGFPLKTKRRRAS